MKKIFLTLFSVALLQICFADFLTTNRKTSVKAEPSSSSAVLKQIEEGVNLHLLDNGAQTNGYYHVSESSLFTGDGWIYRTFVKRTAGNFDGGIAGCGTGDVEIKVADIGAGLCTLIKLPDGKFIVYDAGVNTIATETVIHDFIPLSSDIELMVLSHTDADHIGKAGDIINTYHVKKVIWVGYSRVDGGSASTNTNVYNELVEALSNHPETENENLKEDGDIVPGRQMRFGDVTLTFLCGFGKPLDAWHLSEPSEKINSVSIIMKLEYCGNSVLFCGDAVGRHNEDPDQNAIIATEKFLIDNASQFLPSKVLIAPHHGADNGSSTAFINAVSAEWVVFSAGHKSTYQHPRATAAIRYLNRMSAANMLRTDRGDDEGKSPDKEWNHDRIPGCEDVTGDDDIIIKLRGNRTYSVFYKDTTNECN